MNNKIKKIKMKKTILFSSAVLVLLLSACGNNPASQKANADAFDTAKLKTGEAFYQCEMHPEVISDKPGSCPKCGMDLVKREKK